MSEAVSDKPEKLYVIEESTYSGSRQQKKRPWQQREWDLLDQARLYAQGKSQIEVMQYMKENRPYQLSQAQAAHDLREILKRWREDCSNTVEAQKAKALARIDELERTYREAWEASKKPQTDVHTEEIDDKTTSSKNITLPAYSRRKKSSSVKSSYGDLKALEGIQWCINMRAKILGLNAPEEIHVKDWRKEAERAGIENPAALFNDLVGMYVKKVEAAEQDES